MNVIDVLHVSAQLVRSNKYAEAIQKERYITVYAMGIDFCSKTCEVVIEECHSE